MTAYLLSGTLAPGEPISIDSLSRDLERLGAHLHRFRLLGNNGVTDGGLAVQEHEAVYAAIAEGSAESARKAMKRHVQARAMCDQ